MDFFEEDDGPKFLFHSKASQQPTRSDPETPPLHKPTILLSLFVSTLFLTLSFTYLTSEPVKSILIWISLSFLVGPFAPPSLTAGDIRVGVGPPLEELAKESESSDDNSKKTSKRASKSTRKSDDTNFGSGPNGSGYVGPAVESSNGTAINGNGPSTKLAKNEVNMEMEWTDEDDELLKKWMGKHPVGKPGRWEAIAGGFQGRHTVESVIKRAKELGEKKVNDDDSYTKFLKDRKPVDRQIESGNESNISGSENNEGKGETIVGWSSGEDLALLNALKVFPKDVAMRWEKIAAAVPGKSKAACMRRVTHLKKDFRSSKASGGSVA